MGHRDSSEKQRGAGGVCGIGGGFGAVDEERVKVAMNTSGGSEVREKERDRLKSVPPWVVDSADEAGGARSASTAQTRRSAGVKAALAALRIYKVYLSVLFAGSCRFEPSCSMYAYEAIERFGVMRGAWMGLKRLLRCQPLSRKFGYDPVPERNDGMHSNCSAAAQVESRTAVNPREAHS